MVPTWKRHLSKFEVIDNARKLQELVSKIIFNEKYVSKKQRFFICKDLSESVNKIVDNLIIANTLDIKTNKDKRLEYQNNALCYVNVFENYFILLIGSQKIPESIILEVGELLDKERGLIAKWKLSDK